MKHFHRTSLHPDQILATADAFFPTIGMQKVAEGPRTRTFKGTVGTPEVPSILELSVKMEGGHYTFIEAYTDQMGESRLDRGVKTFFVRVHTQVDTAHTFAPSF